MGRQGCKALIPDSSIANEEPNQNVDTQANEVESCADNFDFENVSRKHQDKETPKAEISSTQGRKRRRMSRGEKKKSTAEKLQEALDRLIARMDELSRLRNAKAKRAKANNYDPHSLGKCFDLLHRVPNLEEGSPRYYLALRMFAKRSYREIFVHLMNKDPSSILIWLNEFSIDYMN